MSTQKGQSSGQNDSTSQRSNQSSSPDDAHARDNRHYQATPLSTLVDGRHDGSGEVLKMLYGEVCNTWRQLTDVRFRLLALVPAVSIFVIASLLVTDITKQVTPAAATSAAATENITAKQLNPVILLGFAIAGFLVSTALYTYEKRNTELYNDLISRGRKIETELGVDTGLFRGRLESSRKLAWFLPVKHDVAINVVYGTTIIAWFLVGVVAVLRVVANWNTLWDSLRMWLT
jgi:hypothetical protein